ncbi:hypothetical protein [Rahnella variigena]|uniref:hypothetical protein n=1 Tax=Rahnella variigena TaxID=574964 RepID=UPI00133030F8|nr:hypothetical protein [Rahnella variigena]
MSTEKSVSGLVTPEENLITQLAGYIHGGLPMQMTTLVGVLQLLERQTSEIISLNQQLSAKIISEQNIINAFCISGEDAHSKLVIEYVHGLVAENQFLKESYEDDIGAYSATIHVPHTSAAIAEIKASELDDLAKSIMEYAPAIEADEYYVYEAIAKDITDRAANLRAGRKG